DLASDALPHLLRLANSQPDSAAVRLRLVSCYTVLRQKDAARRLIDSVLQRWPDMPAALAARGQLALLDGNPDEAESWLRRCLVQLRRDEEARAEEERAESLKTNTRRIRHLLFAELQRRPLDPELHSEIGRLSLSLGSSADGLRWLQSALQLNPHHKASHEALADHYRRMGNQGLAARHKELAQNSPPARQPR